MLQISHKLLTVKPHELLLIDQIWVVESDWLVGIQSKMNLAVALITFSLYKQHVGQMVASIRLSHFRVCTCCCLACATNTAV